MRNILWSVGVLVAFALVASGYASYQQSKINFVDKLPELTESRSLYFADGPDSSVVVKTTDGIEIARFERGTNAFARVVLRGMGRERRLHGLTLSDPLQLGRDAGGALYLIDIATSNQITLDAFGPTNAQVFEDLLDKAQRL